MAWYYFVAAATIAAAFQTIFRKLTLRNEKDIGVYGSAVLLSFSVFVVLLLYILITNNFIMPPFKTIWLIVIVNIVLALIGWLTSQKALSKLATGEFTVLMSARLAVTWIASIFLLSIGVTSRQGLGVILIIFALVVAFYNRKDFLRSNSIGIIFALLTALNYGVGTIFDQIIYRVSDPVSYAVIGFGINTILLILIRPRIATKSFRILADRRTTLIYVVAGILTALTTVLLFTGLKAADNATLVTSISQTQVLLVAIFGAIIFKAERKDFKRVVLAACIASVAAILILL